MARPLDLTKPRYDQSTYWGRVRHFVDLTDPRTLFVSSGRLRQAVDLVETYKRSPESVRATPDELYYAKKLVDSSVHPDTKQPILLPFRMSSFVPTNLIVTVGLLLPNATVAQTVFWQWINQSVNVAFNYCNANKTTPMSNYELGRAYIAATATSCGVALGLKRLVSKASRFPPGVSSAIRLLIPYTSVALAGAVNVFLMRQNELSNGITVVDEDGNSHGNSSKAGLQAVSQVAISRMVIALPSLTLPPIAYSLLERKTTLLTRFPRASLPLNLVLIAGVGLTSLPFAIALFPQTASIPASALEAQFQDRVNPATGKRVETYYYNRGL